MSKFKVGDDMYIFDVNRRRYRKDANGRPVGGPIYREHFERCRITAEEERSFVYAYVDGDGNVQRFLRSIGKTTAQKHFTASEVDDNCWTEDHRAKIANAVMQIRDADTLRRIANVIGYDANDGV